MVAGRKANDLKGTREAKKHEVNPPEPHPQQPTTTATTTATATRSDDLRDHEELLSSPPVAAKPPPAQNQPQPENPGEEGAGGAEAQAETTNPSEDNNGNNGDRQGKKTKSKTVNKLYKSSRLKGYLTIGLASLINYNAAQKSNDVIAGSGTVPSTTSQRNYATAVAWVSLILSGLVVLMHLDTVTCLEKVWISTFQSKSKCELLLATFLIIWWSVATGVQTSVRGVAGDGKGQYSLYFSTWACCITSYWILERWWVAAGLSSLKSFITSWPYRSPGWLCIAFLGLFTLIWYLDLWKNHKDLDGKSVPGLLTIEKYFAGIPEIQWQILISLIVFTIAPAFTFVLVEITRETNPDGSNKEKSENENFFEGLCLLVLVLCWIPAIIWATAPGGAAALVGNAYFSSWLMVIFVAETGVWFVHDLRERIHRSLEQKEMEYRAKQRQVAEKARAMQQQQQQQQGGVETTTTFLSASINDDWQAAMNWIREDAAMKEIGGIDSDNEDDDDDDDEDESGEDNIFLDALTEL